MTAAAVVTALRCEPDPGTAENNKLQVRATLDDSRHSRIVACCRKTSHERLTVDAFLVLIFEAAYCSSIGSRRTRTRSASKTTTVPPSRSSVTAVRCASSNAATSSARRWPRRRKSTIDGPAAFERAKISRSLCLPRSPFVVQPTPIPGCADQGLWTGRDRGRGRHRDREQRAVRRAAATGSGRAETSRRLAQRQLAFLHGERCVPQALGHVFSLEIWMLAENLIDGHPVGDHRHHRRNGKPKVTNARQAAYPLRIDRDPRERHRQRRTPTRSERRSTQVLRMSRYDSVLVSKVVSESLRRSQRACFCVPYPHFGDTGGAPE